MTLDDLRKIAEEATSGPWTVEREVEETDFGKFEIFSVDPVTAFSWNADDTPAHTALDTLEEADAEFIATFNPQKVLVLIDSLKIARDVLSVNRAMVEALEARVGPCHCDKNPDTTGGPSEDCPQHGRPYAEWVKAANYANNRLAAVEKLHSEYEPFCGNPQHTNLDVGCPDCAYICAGCGEVWPCDDIKAVRGE